MDTDVVARAPASQELCRLAGIIAALSITVVAVGAYRFQPGALAAVVTGYVVSVGIGSISIYWLARKLLQIQEAQAGQAGTGVAANAQWQALEWAVLLGVVERVIYTSAAIIGAYEMIAGWFVLKSVVHFAEEKRSGVLLDYYNYLVGTGVSLLFGIGGGMLVRLLMSLPAAPPS